MSADVQSLEQQILQVGVKGAPEAPVLMLGIRLGSSVMLAPNY